MSDRDSMQRRIARGTALNYLGFFAGKVIVFLNTVILARLLAPEDFGLVAIGLLVLAVSETIAEAGTGAAVVWRPGDVVATAPVALTIGLIGATVMAGAAFVLAPQIARFFGAPEVTAIIRVLAFAALLSTPASVFTAILQKRMAFGRRLVPEVSKAVTKGLVGIPLAWWGFGEWSLVYGQIAGVGVGLILSWWLSGWRVRLSLAPNVVRDVLPYGIQIAAVGLLGLAIRRMDVTIVGRRLDATELGFYTLAFSLVELSVMGICWSASQAFFPALSRSNLEPEKLVQVFRQGLTTLMAVTVPVAIGLALVADPLIHTLYGEKWAGAVQPMRLLCFYALIFSMGFNIGDVYKATGRPAILTWINLANLVFAAPILLAGSAYGLSGVALGQVAVAAIISAVNWAAARRLAGLRIGILLAALRGPGIAALAMAAVCLVLDSLLLAQTAAPLRAAILIGAGGGTYVAALALAMPEAAKALRSAWRRG